MQQQVLGNFVSVRFFYYFAAKVFNFKHFVLNFTDLHIFALEDRPSDIVIFIRVHLPNISMVMVICAHLDLVVFCPQQYQLKCSELGP